MAHKVKFSLPERELGHADIEFKVDKDGTRFGTLKISKGTLVWVPRDSTYGYKLGWTDFAELMKRNGNHENS